MKTTFYLLGDIPSFPEQNRQLALLPVPNIAPRNVIDVADDVMLYPAGTVDIASLRVVHVPDCALAESMRRLKASPHQVLELEGSELAWFASAATFISAAEFFAAPLIVLPVSLDWDRFLSPADHDVHLAMMHEANQIAEARLAAAGLDLARLAAPGLCPGPIGRLPGTVFDAALFYTPIDDESYIIAGQIPGLNPYRM